MPQDPYWIDPAGVPVRIFGKGLRPAWRDWAFALGVAWTLFRQRRRYQLVYFLMQGLHLAVGLPVARYLRKSIVMKVSGSSIITHMGRSRAGRLELTWLRKWAHRVMVLNTGIAAEAEAAGLTPEQLLWMPNPVDTEEFSPCDWEHRSTLRARLALSQQALAVIFVGRLAPEKELPSLFKAFASVVKEAPRAVLILVGDGPVRKDLEVMTGELHLKASIRFIGRQTPAQVSEWLRASDVFALVSSNEGFPCSLAEAMSSGLPSVVSDIPANLQLIDPGVHGLHVSVRSVPSIAAALTQLLADEVLRTRMGLAARQRVIDNYSLDRVLDRYEAMFSEVLDRAPR
jgi:glycosyltransferase involved in cell wall biosynthesis